MLVGFAGLVLLTALPLSEALHYDNYRKAVEIARSEEVKRQAFAAQYQVQLPGGPGEIKVIVEIFTPFREMVERASVQPRRVAGDYTHNRATQDLQEFGDTIRVRVHILLPYNAVPRVSLGEGYRLVVSFRSGAPGKNRAVEIEPRFTVIPILDGTRIGEVILETSLSLSANESQKVGLEGPFTVIVKAPNRQDTAARFNLADLR